MLVYSVFLYKEGSNQFQKSVKHNRKYNGMMGKKMGKEKVWQQMVTNQKWRKLEQIISVIVFLLIQTVMIHTEGGIRSFLHLGSRKCFLVAIADIIFVILLFWGNRLCALIENTVVFKFLNGLMIIITPLILFVTTQMITQLCRIKSISKTSFLRLMYAAVNDMSLDNILRNLIIYYFILAFLFVVIRKINIACVVYSVLLIVLALVNYYVTEFRGEAFLLLDILGTGTAAEVVGEYTIDVPIYIGILLLLNLDFCKFQIQFQKISIARRKMKKVPYILCQLGIIILLGGSSVYAVQNAPIISFWNTNKSYSNSGYLSSLASETRYLTAEKPKEYSIPKVKEISEEVSATKQSTTVVIPQNIIMIMNESLADFESIGEVKTDSEILPFIHSLNENVKHGLLHVPTFGGGTARSEYEALSGNSMYFLPAGSVPYQLYVGNQESGMAETLNAQGYSTIAVHPNKASNWNRANVYSSMGFDEFISIENWGDEDREKLRNYISDEAVYNKLIKLYEQKQSGEKLFTFCVTMQNHGGYEKDKLNGYEPDVELNYKRSYPKAEIYLSLAHESDNAFKKLLEYFEKVDEPTMIIMFGDHWPRIETQFMNEVLGKNKQDLDWEEIQNIYTTPYVIWTNYPSETVEQDMSSNYLGSYVLEQAGVELTNYNHFLLSLKDTLPIIGVGAVCDSKGNWYAQDQLPEEYQKLITDYNILEYNNQFDKKNKVIDFFDLAQSQPSA